MFSAELENSFRTREYGLLERVQAGTLRFTSVHAKRHLREGFARRLLLMQTSRLKMAEFAPLSRQEKLSTYECAELNVHLNSWYLQLRGALDNLAWTLHYEFGLLGPGDEDNVSTRRRCDLFGSDFLKAVRLHLPRLVSVLDERASWAGDLKTLRDPAAHRVPMYAVPGVMFDDDRREFDRLSIEAEAAAKVKDIETVRARMFDAEQLGVYQHVFAMSGNGGIQLRRLPEQLTADFSAFLATAAGVVSEVEQGTR